jgi:NADPH:quinone reductase-like Zn-dependent oxidoreductase
MDKPDVIIDAVYFGTYQRSVDLLQPGDRLVVLPTLADLEPARARGLNVSVPSIQPDRDRLERLAGMIADGDLEVVVSEVLPLERVADAHRMVESGHAVGKVVLRVGG